MNISIDITEADFDRLCQSSMPWALHADDWAAQDGRFEVSDRGLINYRARIAYWVGEDPAAMILARAFIQAQGFDAQLLWDMSEFPDGSLNGYVLLTDYATTAWQEHSDGIVIRADATHRSEWSGPDEEDA